MAPPLSILPSKIAILGSGALGLFYGARLALAGNDVRFLMRGDLAAVRARGSIIAHLKEGDERLEVRPVAAFETTDEIGLVDLVVVTLKTTANESLKRLLPPLIGGNTTVLTLQNGLGPDEQIAAIVGAGRVLSGLGFIGATRTAPGEVTVYRAGYITLGQFNGAPTERTRGVATLWEAAGLKVKAIEDVVSARWHKLVWNVPFNGLAIAAGGIPTDQICANPALVARARLLMKDVQRAAAAVGVTIADEFLQQQYDVTPSMGRYQPSSVIDYLAGREVELESIWGEPLRRAQAAGASVPELEKLYHELRLLVK
jgi:2-dehydropantoate 2-reductase